MAAATQPRKRGTAAISAIGAVTSVGRYAEAACAAIRAGLARPRPLGELAVVDEEAQEPKPVFGHPVDGFTDGFQLVGRWLRLARGCVDDLLSRGGVPPAGDAGFWSRTGLVAVGPIPDDDVFLTAEGQALGAVVADYLQALPRALGIGFAPDAIDLVARGHAGTASGLDVALARLGSGLERVLLLAVDSLIDPLLLQKLAAGRRLKADETPTGLMPGEAGVAILLESEATARHRGASASTIVAAVATDREPNPLGAGEPGSGRGVAASVGRVLDAVSPGAPFSGDVIVDLNGESWRAQDWGMALVRLASRLQDPPLHLPSTSLGDVGAASGAIGVALGVHLLGRGAARDQVLVVSTSETGETGCVALRRAPR